MMTDTPSEDWKTMKRGASANKQLGYRRLSSAGTVGTLHQYPVTKPDTANSPSRYWRAFTTFLTAGAKYWIAAPRKYGDRLAVKPKTEHRTVGKLRWT